MVAGISTIPILSTRKTASGEKMKINLDGEYGGDAPMTFVNLRQHIEMFANVDEIPDRALSADPTEATLLSDAARKNEQ